MEPYKDVSGRAGVLSYEIGENFIVVEFKPSALTGKTIADYTIYKYTYRMTGVAVVEEMKRLALEGKVLSTYISRHNPYPASKR